MTVGRFAALALVLLMTATVQAQRGRRGSGGGATAQAGPIRGLVMVAHGTLKQVSKSTILIQTDDDRIMTIRRSRKTRFLADGHEVKANEVDLETAVSIEMSEDGDAKFTAFAVKVDPVQKERVPNRRPGTQ